MLVFHLDICVAEITPLEIEGSLYSENQHVPSKRWRREEVCYRGGSRGVRRVLEHPSNLNTFTAKNDNCSEAVLKIIKLLLLIMTTALKLC